MRLIDADALVDDGLRFQDGYDYDGIMMVRLGNVTKSIRNAPTIDAVPVVYGEWLRTSTWWVYCSVCGCEPPQETNATTRFCPNCGAKMTNGGTEE